MCDIEKKQLQNLLFTCLLFILIYIFISQFFMKRCIGYLMHLMIILFHFLFIVILRDCNENMLKSSQARPSGYQSFHCRKKEEKEEKYERMWRKKQTSRKTMRHWKVSTQKKRHESSMITLNHIHSLLEYLTIRAQINISHPHLHTHTHTHKSLILLSSAPQLNPLTPRRTLVAPFTKISNLF